MKNSQCLGLAEDSQDQLAIQKHSLPVIQLKMFRMIDPLSKTRRKKLLFPGKHLIAQSTNDTPNAVREVHMSQRTKTQCMEEIRQMQNNLHALKHFKEPRYKTEGGSDIELHGGLGFFNRSLIQTEVGKCRSRKDKVQHPTQINIRHLSLEQANAQQSCRVSPEKNLEMRTLLSNQIRNQLLLNVKTSSILLRRQSVVKRENTEQSSRLPDIRKILESDNLVKRRRYKKSLNSRTYNPYYSYLAMSSEDRRSILLNFQKKQDGLD